MLDLLRSLTPKHLSLSHGPTRRLDLLQHKPSTMDTIPQLQDTLLEFSRVLTSKQLSFLTLEIQLLSLRRHKMDTMVTAPQLQNTLLGLLRPPAHSKTAELPHKAIRLLCCLFSRFSTKLQLNRYAIHCCRRVQLPRRRPPSVFHQEHLETKHAKSKPLASQTCSPRFGLVRPPVTWLACLSMRYSYNSSAPRRKLAISDMRLMSTFRV